MTEKERFEREAVRAEARRWNSTPYHHRAAVLGAGIDCAQILHETFVGAGLIERRPIPKYTPDWHLHRSEEVYLNIVEEYCNLVSDDERPIKDRGADFHVELGDILMWRVGRTFSHSAIVTGWPFIIHAYLPSSIVEEVDVRNSPMAERPMRVYSYWDHQS